MKLNRPNFSCTADYLNISISLTICILATESNKYSVCTNILILKPHRNWLNWPVLKILVELCLFLDILFKLQHLVGSEIPNSIDETISNFIIKRISNDVHVTWINLLVEEPKRFYEDTDEFLPICRIFRIRYSLKVYLKDIRAHYFVTFGLKRDWKEVFGSESQF